MTGCQLFSAFIPSAETFAVPSRTGTALLCSSGRWYTSFGCSGVHSGGRLRWPRSAAGRSPGHTIIRSRHNGRRGSAAVFSLGILSNLLSYGIWLAALLQDRFQPPGGGGDHGELVHATADDGAAMDDREPGAYCFANEPEDIGLVCCGQTRETKAAQSSTAPPWWLL